MKQDKLSASGSGPHLQLGSRGELVRALQNQLEAIGLDVGQVDGIFGQKTLNAVKAFQRSNGLVPRTIPESLNTTRRRH